MNHRAQAVLAALMLALPSMGAAAPAGPSDLPGGHYVLDPRHASVVARVLHMGVSRYTLRFDTMDATFDYDPAHPERTRVQASIVPASLDVGADWSLKFANEFLSADKFPRATFVSTSIQPTTGAQGLMTGDLTLMGVTKSVTFNVTLIGAGRVVSATPPFFHNAAGFEATTTIKRSDFGSTFLNNMVGDDVSLEIEAEFEHK